ncbi:MAG: hypothetical protein JJU02_10755 [Cryomorphaceae bacterium]|nr:hypothetical protein [Cryomorphaceae bacterium]
MAPKQLSLEDKQILLDQASETLKKEFIGLNRVIDEIVNGISGWFMFPHLQTSPAIINAWGITGTGKSSLIRRLAQLIRFDHRFFPFDLGDESESYWGIRRILTQTFETHLDDPIIMVFDEFQHARTISENGYELRSSAKNLIWQLLDTGKFPLEPNHSFVINIIETIRRLEYIVDHTDVKVKNGVVVQAKKAFREEIQLDSLYKNEYYEDKPLYFAPPFLERIIQLTLPTTFRTESEVRMHLNTMDAMQTLNFLQSILNRAQKPKYIDLSRSLIFISGNLDEAFRISGDLSPDRDADSFANQTAKINITDIKVALQKRFRPEQIARLGNTHIIYPVFNASQYAEIISQKLESIRNFIWQSENINLEFDLSINRFLYDEGVFPSQGVRPVISSIRHYIEAHLGRICTEWNRIKEKDNHIFMEIEGNCIRVDFLLHTLEIHQIKIPLHNKIHALRQSKRDDFQAVTAVHEAGHVVCNGILLKQLPVVVYSQTTNEKNGGFMLNDQGYTLQFQNEILPRLAVFLGGIAAEEFVFGKENISTGSSGDIQKATRMVLDMLRECGMHSVPVFINNCDERMNYHFRDPEHTVEKQTEILMTKAHQLARDTIAEQSQLFFHIADYLSDHHKLGKEEIRDLFTRHAVNFPIEQFDNKDKGYRSVLKKKVLERKEIYAN